MHQPEISRTFQDPTGATVVIREERREAAQDAWRSSHTEKGRVRKRGAPSAFSPRAAPEVRAGVLGQQSQELRTLSGNDPRKKMLARDYRKLVALQTTSNSRNRQP